MYVKTGGSHCAALPTSLSVEEGRVPDRATGILHAAHMTKLGLLLVPCIS